MVSKQGFESALEKLFDFQRFCGSEKLGAVICSALAEGGDWRELSDDEAELWAAGEELPDTRPEDRKDGLV